MEGHERRDRHGAPRPNIKALTWVMQRYHTWHHNLVTLFEVWQVTKVVCAIGKGEASLWWSCVLNVKNCAIRESWPGKFHVDILNVSWARSCCMFCATSFCMYCATQQMGSFLDVRSSDRRDHLASRLREYHEWYTELPIHLCSVVIKLYLRYRYIVTRSSGKQSSERIIR
jgi:hypothetical protein